ncbi:MAG: hypothetical protein ACI9YU_001295 [Flavobacteriales bacterium]|jgi:hypothetical protein
MENRLLILLSIAILMVSCSKDEQTDAPVINDLVIGPMIVEEFSDTVTVSFIYEDINGDIGQVDPNVNSIYIRDSRLATADEYHIPPQTPDLQQLDIQGSISLRLNNLFILGNDSTESVVLTVTMVDRAGNVSNELVSDSVLVIRP